MVKRIKIVCEPLNSFGYRSHRWDVFTNKCLRCNQKKTKPKSRTQLVLEENSKLLKVIKIINAENARYREALEFYADKLNYSLVDEGRNYMSSYVCYEVNPKTYGDDELGTFAREALRGDVTPEKGGE